jgi:hypothetical protein
MPKLPTNLVKPPVFDNPLRRTAPGPAAIEPDISAEPAPAAPASTEPQPGGVVIAIATGARTEDSPTEDTRTEDARTDAGHELTPMPHRITLRIEDQTRRALEAECYRRRVAGEKTNVAEIARGILRDWASDHA